MDFDTVLGVLVIVCPVVLIWHIELIYPVTQSAAGAISSGFVTLENRSAHAFYHLLMWVTVFGVCPLAGYRLLN